MASIKQTFPWATYSKRIALILCSPALAQAKVFLTTEEALNQTFSKADHCTVATETKYLTAEQMKKAETLSGSPTASALVVQYVGTCAGKLKGTAYTDTHKVRTHPETLFIAIDPENRLIKTEVLSFEEPLDYLAKDQWYQSFEKKSLNDELQIKRAIPFVTGASLTGKATLQASRRVLAIHQLLTEKSVPAKK